MCLCTFLASIYYSVGDCTRSSPQCILQSRTLNTWFEARTKCEGNDGLLSTINVTNSALVTDTNRNPGGIRVWTGLHRKEVILWMYGTNIYVFNFAFNIGTKCFERSHHSKLIKSHFLMSILYFELLFGYRYIIFEFLKTVFISLS